MSQAYRKEILVKGKPTEVMCFDLMGNTFTVSGAFPRIVRIEDEWYEDIADPRSVVEAIKSDRTFPADVLEFWNPLPVTEPVFEFPSRTEEIAVLHIKSYQDWWQHGIKPRTRTLIRKAEKQGLEVRESEFDDSFVSGMSAIFNESPVRQGRRFWHFGKSPEVVRRQFSRFIHRETMIGAYLDGRMVGFMMVGHGGACAHVGQILSLVAARELNPNNALMAKAVEVCARLGRQHLVYGYWSGGGLTEFKRRCGFEPVGLPHYFVPLNRRGDVAIALGIQQGWRDAVPVGITSRLKVARARFHAWRTREPARRATS